MTAGVGGVKFRRDQAWGLATSRELVRRDARAADARSQEGSDLLARDRVLCDHPARARDPQQRPQEEPAHDILAAEAFAMPAADPSSPPPVALPDDPAGILEPHDILAAEEFAMPAPPMAEASADSW